MKPSIPAEELAPWLSEASDASPELRAFLRDAAAPPNDAARVERLRHRLGPWLALPITASPPPAIEPSPATLSLGVAGKAGLIAVGVSVGALTVGSWVASRAPEPVHDRPTAPALVVSVQAPTPAPSVVAAPLPSSSAAPMRAPQLVPKAPLPLPSLAEEAADLAKARQALAASPGLALSRLQEHERKYPRGVLAEERRLFTVQALVALGQRAEAARELQRWQRLSPQSPHLPKAQKLVGGSIKSESSAQ